jgi:hypothetical protein
MTAVDSNRESRRDRRGAAPRLHHRGDLGALILIAWLIPFIILAIITPQGLAFRAIVALIHWL